MKPAFWIKRFLVVFAGVFLVLVVVGSLKGRATRTVVLESAFWSLVTTSIFIATRLIRSRQGQHCELCRDTPELARGGQCELKQSPEPTAPGGREPS
jgi:hypothetical protein